MQRVIIAVLLTSSVSMAAVERHEVNQAVTAPTVDSAHFECEARVTAQEANFNTFEGLIDEDMTFEIQPPSFARRMLIKFGFPIFMQFLQAKSYAECVWAKTLILSGWRKAEPVEIDDEE